MPVAFFFSYWPVIQLGGNETMNFELSLPLIWLVVFDVTGFVALCRERKLFEGLKNKWMWLLFPVWLTISVIWSLNATRGILTVGILWLICFAVYAMWSFRNWFDAEFRVKWLKWFLVSALVACLWCMVQCVLDLVGIGQDVSLMCDGCTYRMFGFPHPNGFAIEPQFMGNLLLAPAIVEVGWLMLRLRPRPAGPSPRAAGAKSRAAALRNAASPKHHAILFFMFASTIFLTFSRGAIYAFVVAMIFMTAFMIVKEKKKRSEVAKRIGVAWGIVAFSFLFTLNLQGIMAQVSPTNDTYITGVGKVLNHLSLGVIDIRGERESLLPEEPEADLTKKGNDDVKNEVVENSVENLEDNRGESVFDGYVAESTDTRLKLSGAAVKIWSQDFKTAVFGVGLGGAGQALYNNDLSPAPKEIVQNEYASLLLETGIIGVSLLILTLVLIIRVAIKSSASGLVLTILVAYGVTLCFFSGLPNALQIYLLPMMIYMVFRK
ncbi:O-antigen ligase family protein [Candidatus Saccharibacteria bacterium]|nr:O-antigen ligase family protein [Candidatus Saccharibacteria bacterium]